MTGIGTVKLLSLTVLISFICGCAGFSLSGSAVVLDKAKYQAADIFVIYYPYPAERNKYTYDAKIDFSPVVDISTWHYERMERDLDDMKTAGIDGVFLCLTPQDMADKSRREMISSFVKRCEEKTFKIVFCMSPENNMILSPGNTCSYIEGRNWGKSSSMYKLDDNILIVFSEKAMMSREMWMPGYHCQQMNLSLQEGHSPLPFTLVKSIANLENLKKDRSKGHVLIENLNIALASTSRIVIASWNNYADGTAIERNKLDYDALLKALQ